MTIASGSGSGGRIYFADGTGSDADKKQMGTYFITTLVNIWHLVQAGGSEKMRIETDGQVQVSNVGGVR